MIFINKKTQHGRIYKCAQCEQIHIEFNNINFNFSEKEFLEFSNYLKQVNGAYWEEKNKNSLFCRKIRIPLNSKSFCLMLTNNELDELRELLSPPTPCTAIDIILAQYDMIKQLN